MFPRFVNFLLLLVGLIFQTAAGRDCKTGPPSSVMADQCCKTPMMFKPGMFEDCAGKYKTMNCIAQCLMDDSGVLVNKKIDLEYMIYCASTNLKDNKQPFWLGPVERVTRHCVLEAWKGDSLTEDDEDGCQKLPGTVMSCMLMQLSFAVCPEQEWLGAPGCDDNKDFITECMPIK